MYSIGRQHAASAQRNRTIKITGRAGLEEEGHVGV